MSESPIPVTVLTGFLGSGKTTLLNRLLKQDALAETAVIVNEFGEIGIDHLILEPLDGETVVMAAGCLCCTIREDLAATLISLKERRDAGMVPPFERVVIETTGLADPAPIAQFLLTHLDIIDDFSYAGLISTLDACFGEGQLRDTPECAKQIAMADMVILTKLDLAANHTDDLLYSVNLLNPGVPVILAEDVDAKVIVDPASPVRIDWLTLECHALGHHHIPDVNRHSPGIRAVPLVIDEPQDWLAISMWLSFVIFTHGEHLLRVKGLIEIVGEPGPAVVNGVRHVFHKPIRLTSWPSAIRGTHLVFIVRDIDPEVILGSWQEFATAAQKTIMTNERHF